MEVQKKEKIRSPWWTVGNATTNQFNRARQVKGQEWDEGMRNHLLEMEAS